MNTRAAVLKQKHIALHSRREEHPLLLMERSIESWSHCSITLNDQQKRQQTFSKWTVTSRECGGSPELFRLDDTQCSDEVSGVAAVAERISCREPRKISRREQEVLHWMSEGKNTWEISRIMHISERTVYFHVRNILEKLGASSRSHAVSIAIRECIFD